MGRIYESEYAKVVYLPNKKLMIAKWSDKCDNFIEKQYNEESKRIVDFTHKYEVNNLMVDIVDCNYFTEGGSKSWFKNTIYGFFKDVKANKVAIIIPSNLLVHASFDAARESLTDGIKKVNVQYFRNEKKALQWLE